MDAQEQKQQAAKQSSILFSQHHQVHLVRHHSNQAAHTDPHTGSSSYRDNWIYFFFSFNSSLCLPLLSAEAGEEERGGAEEEGVGRPGARKDPEQITNL